MEAKNATTKNKTYLKEIAEKINLGYGDKEYEEFLYMNTQEFLNQYQKKHRKRQNYSLEDFRQHLLNTEYATSIKVEEETFRYWRTSKRLKLSYVWKGKHVALYQDIQKGGDGMVYMYAMREEDNKDNKRRIYLESLSPKDFLECLDCLSESEETWKEKWKEIELAANKLIRKKEMIVNAFSGMLREKMRGNKIPYLICVQRSQIKVLFKVGNIDFSYRFSFKKYMEQLGLAVESIITLRNALESYTGIVRVHKGMRGGAWVQPEE